MHTTFQYPDVPLSAGEHQDIMKGIDKLKLTDMSNLTLRYLLRHKDEYPKDYVEAAEVEYMQRKLMGKLK